MDARMEKWMGGWITDGGWVEGGMNVYTDGQMSE